MIEVYGKEEGEGWGWGREGEGKRRDPRARGGRREEAST